MGKNYAESSLKHYLKQKVRITLGVVVTFLITGTVAFGASLPFTEEQLKEQEIISEMSDAEKAEYFLNGYNKSESINNFKTEGDIFTSDTGKINVKKENGEIKITTSEFQANDFNKEITIGKDDLTKKTAENIEKSLNLVKENGLTEKIQNSVNNGVYTKAIKGNSINNGIIIHGTGSGENGGQHVTAGGEAYNYGIILDTFSNAGAQTIYHVSSAKVYNFGLLYDTITSGQWARGKFNSSTFYNYGTIVAEKYSGQYMEAQGGTINSGNLLNYGIINAKNSGQYFLGYTGANNQYVNQGKMLNYGVITAEKGQLFTGNGAQSSDMINYGIINSQKGGQVIESGTAKGNTVENYGTIKNQGDFAINIAEGNTGINYGTVINNTDNVFSDDTVTNKGIVILDNHEKGTADDSIKAGINEGIILDKNGAVVNDNTVAEYKNGNSEITNTFTDSKTTAYVTGIGNKITENLSDKIVGTIVTDDISEKGAVFNADKNLTLENTVITGYFENSGTLLDMGSNNLTLLGDTKLVASRDDFDSDIEALNIDGTLKKLGNVEISGKITGTGKLQEVATNGKAGEHTEKIELNEILLQNATEQEEKYLAGNTSEEKKANNYTEVSYNGGLETEKVILDFDRTAKDKENTITFTDDLLIKGKDGTAIDGTSTEAGSNINLEFSSLDKDKVQGDILLGASDDDITVSKNGEYNHIIDMGAGNDTFTLGDGYYTNKEIFNYKLNNTEKIVLDRRNWYIGEKAELNAGNTAKVEGKTELHIAENGSLFVEMNNNFGKDNVTTSLDKMASGADLSVTTGEGAEVRFVVGDKFDISQKQFDIAHDYSVKDANLDTAIIFKGTGENGKVQEDETGKITLTVKEGSELGFTGYDEFIYDIVLEGLSKDEALRNAVNNQNLYQLQTMIKGAANTVEAFYTTGYAVTKDVTDTYMSVVEDFGRKAGKGEWIAYGKYVNSDTEFDGGKASKGYDGDITGTVGMIEYGVNDTTSYGVVYGQGDTEVNIDCGGKLDGDNSYFGGYVKHRTQKGIDIVGNIGITKSELDLSLATNVVQGGTNHQIITDGKSDADALTIAVKGTKDYKVSDSVRLQPVVSARYSFITQDEVTSSDAKFRMEEQDVTIFEGSVGGNIIKDFNVYNGTLSLSAGAEYVFADINADDNTRYYLYSETKPLKFTEEEEIADNRIEGHIGAEYIHENGVGIDAKYEMIWTDKGDTDRITAGVSYKF